MDETQVGEIGRALLGVIRARWPLWLDSATQSSSGDLVINRPSPHRADGLSLYLQADPDLDEMIVGFGGAHSHGGPWRESGDVDHELRHSIAFIEGILDESVVFAEFEDSARWLSSLPTLRERDDWGNVKSVRSWRGTYDQG